jgi:hypothetical protein
MIIHKGPKDLPGGIPPYQTAPACILAVYEADPAGLARTNEN